MYAGLITLSLARGEFLLSGIFTRDYSKRHGRAKGLAPRRFCRPLQQCATRCLRRFYPADEIECNRAAGAFVSQAQLSGDDRTRWFGGIVPHAGWICSAAVAGQTIATIARGIGPDVVVVFGAIHTPMPTPLAALDSHRAVVDPRRAIIGCSGAAGEADRSDGFIENVDERFHDREHAVEVELPLIRAAWPYAMVLPVEVPVIDDAVAIGRQTARRSCRPPV